MGMYRKLNKKITEKINIGFDIKKCMGNIVNNDACIE